MFGPNMLDHRVCAPIIIPLSTWDRFYVSNYFEIISATNWLRTCACSLGGPGRNRDEQRGGRSTLGTDWTKKCISIHTSYPGRIRGHNKVLYEAAVLWGPAPYPLYTVFDSKGTSSAVYLLLTNGAPNHIPSLELCIPFNRS